MKEILLCDLPSIYRDNFRVRAFIFGNGKKSVCIVGSTRGNEFQQQYIASRVVKKLKEIESNGQINDGYQIVVIPSANPYSLNISKKFGTIDNSDMNRLFPGNPNGSTAEQINNIIFEFSKDYEYGIHLPSYYMIGSFLPHVRIIKTELEYDEVAKDFMMPYVSIQSPKPFEKSSLNYNWQKAGVKAFSLYSSQTEGVDKNSAHLILRSILLFLRNRSIINTQILGGYESEFIDENNRIISVKTPQAGFFVPKVKVGFEIEKGDLLAEIHDPYTDEISAKIIAPVSGIVYFMYSKPLTYGHTAIIKLII